MRGLQARLLATTALTIVALCVPGITAGYADVLNILDTSNVPANTPEGVQRPVKGMTMDEVENFFGSPREKLGPVGDPPISRWVYDGYTVHFEHQYVIHAVVHPEYRQ